MKILVPLFLICAFAVGGLALAGCTAREKSRPTKQGSRANDKNMPGTPHRTGLIPPTPEERAAMDRMLINTGDVRLNRLGLERINSGRAKKGLPPLEIEPAADGHEVVPKP